LISKLLPHPGFALDSRELGGEVAAEGLTADTATDERQQRLAPHLLERER
jgi:hypothetical protein